MTILPGCNQRFREESEIVVDFNTVRQDSIPYSSFVDSISYLSLMPDGRCMIGDISNIAFIDSCIVIFDSKSHQVLLFNKDGRYLRNIGDRGAGHGEFIYPTKMDVDIRNKQILIYDRPKGEVLKYNLNNVYIGTDSIGHASDMTFLGNRTYLITNYNDDINTAGIFFINCNTNNYVRLADCRDNIPTNKPWEIFRNGETPIIMTRPYEDAVMEWNGTELTSILKFNIHPSPNHQALSEMKSHPRETLKYPNRMLYLSSNRWFYSYYWLDDEVKFIFFDLKNRKLTLASSLYNDLDGIYGMELPICIDNAFVNVVYPEEEFDNPKLQFLHLKD